MMRNLILIMNILGLLAQATSFCQTMPLAFPGAEGYGRFTSGGRGGEVIEVTNLNDRGAGSLRAAIETPGPRTIVFRVSGNIRLESDLIVKEGNLTIAGQSAPGDGICIRDYPVIVDADNVIIRFLRIRLGDIHELQADALSVLFRKDIMIDHCSLSWGIDEVASLWDDENSTLQWCIISESLNRSYHSKGAHGYGGIWGGKGASFHHNLLAHHSSRTPRFNGSRYHGEPEKERVDFRNNVIYNWGENSAYGGEGGYYNIVANYYKYGPASRHKNRIVEPYDGTGKWYIAQNFVFGFPEITRDNWAGGVQGEFWKECRVDTPFSAAPVITHTAEEAYSLVLSNAGAILPRRDLVDQRIIREVRNGTATFGRLGNGIIDSQTDVGSWPPLRSEPAPPDSDHDGMPDDWEKNHGLNPADPADRNGDPDGNGYTNLEEYLNGLVSEIMP
ncbi:MAG: pectate lyase [Calditrichia bacterium]